MFKLTIPFPKTFWGFFIGFGRIDTGNASEPPPQNTETKPPKKSIKRPETFKVSAFYVKGWEAYGNPFGCSVCEVKLNVGDTAINLNKSLLGFVHEDCWTENVEEILEKIYKERGWKEPFHTQM